MLLEMVLESSHLIGSAVIDVGGVKHGTIDRCVYLADEGCLHGFQVAVPGVITKFRSLELADCISLNQESVVIDSPTVIQKDLKPLDEIVKKNGPVVGLGAVTESGKKLGKVFDLLLDADTGFIVRLYVRALLNERIIPRQFVVSITPEQVVFKDVVDTPLFDQVASAEASAI